MNKVVGYVVVAFVLWTLFSSSVKPPSSIAGKQPIDYATTDFGGWKAATDGDGTLTIRNRTGDVLGEYVLGSSGVLHESPEQAKSGLIVASYKPDLYLGRWWLDAGAFASVDDHLRLGIRVSPARLLWGVVAPDVVASESALGVGISLYTPSRSVGTWSHLGVGVWYLHDLDRDSNNLSLGLSTSLR